MKSKNGASAMSPMQAIGSGIFCSLVGVLALLGAKDMQRRGWLRAFYVPGPRLIKMHALASRALIVLGTGLVLFGLYRLLISTWRTI